MISTKSQAANPRIDLPPSLLRPVDFADKTPRFIVTVDTEEEFDWGKPIQREGFTLETIPKLEKFQLFCTHQGVCPIYLVDYPVINFAPAVEALRSFVESGAAHIGVQLHPWVSPPLDEAVSQKNSFAGNLPEALERTKLLRLAEAITQAIGQAPIIYRAGRYGVGPNTLPILQEAGIKIDTSVRANFDYSLGEGPDFSAHPLVPYWLDEGQTMAELPLTTVFWGMLRRQGRSLFPRLAGHPMLKSLLSRSAMLERIALTPEGITIEEAIKGIDIALDDGLPLLNFSFQSPSLRAGYTPYVHEEADVDHFYDWWRRVLAYLALRDVRPASLDDLVREIWPQK